MQAVDMRPLPALLALAVAAAGTTGVAAAALARADAGGTLVATVGPGFTIDLADGSGKHVDVVEEGHYSILVRDRSAEHNFVLASKPDGTRVRIDSGVEFVGDATFEVDLFPARYGYACSPHWQVMNGQLLVTMKAPPTAKKPAKPKSKKKPKKKKKRKS